MITYTANEAKTRFGELLDTVQRQPVQVSRHNRIVGVVVSAHDYEQMQDYYADRLNRTMDEAAREANLTEAEVEELLRDDS